MASVNIKEVNGGEDTTPAGTDAIEIDNGTTSMWVLLSNLYKALGTGTATAAKALMGDGAWTTVTTPTSTETMTNKRITKRDVTVTVAAEPAINTDNGDIFRIGVTGDLLDLAVTSLTTNLTGTPTHGQMILLEFLDDGTARAITHGASFRAGTGNALLTTTTLNKLCKELLQWDSADSKWDCVGTWVEA